MKNISKNISSRLNQLLLIILAFLCFQNIASASLNPLKWLSPKDRTSEVIEIENDNEKGTEKLIKKLTKYEAKDNEKAKQKIYKSKHKLIASYTSEFHALETYVITFVSAIREFTFTHEMRNN